MMKKRSLLESHNRKNTDVLSTLLIIVRVPLFENILLNYDKSRIDFPTNRDTDFMVPKPALGGTIVFLLKVCALFPKMYGT